MADGKFSTAAPSGEQNSQEVNVNFVDSICNICMVEGV